jgi:hypothetical protein
MYNRGHPKVNVFFIGLIFTLNHRRPKMSQFYISVKKMIESIFFKCHDISLRFRQLPSCCKARRKLIMSYYLLELFIIKILTPAARTPMNTA